MRDVQTLQRALIRAAKLQAVAEGGGATTKSILEGILSGKFTEVQAGKILIGSDSPEGFGVQFHVPKDWDSARIIELAESAIEWIETLPDGTDPVEAMKRRRIIKRLRASF